MHGVVFFFGTVLGTNDVTSSKTVGSVLILYCNPHLAQSGDQNMCLGYIELCVSE